MRLFFIGENEISFVTTYAACYVFEVINLIDDISKKNLIFEPSTTFAGPSTYRTIYFGPLGPDTATIEGSNI